MIRFCVSDVSYVFLLHNLDNDYDFMLKTVF